MPFNVTGTPALSVPTGFTDDGLPLGMQIVGRANDEAMVYRVAYAYEQVTRWSERHPTL
jgi:Asp-tRNA(Asn)/Glu-tRNA(Gln) amidotransferase A subunit family amidase